MSEARTTPTTPPPEAWTAAREGALLVERPDLRWWTIGGRDPGRMLNGVVSGTMPLPLADDQLGGRVGTMTWQTVLTPKGKVVSDLKLGSEAIEGEGEGERFFALVPTAGVEGLEEHFGRYLPPRFALAEDRGEEIGVATLAGPKAVELITRVVFGLRVEAADLHVLGPGGVRTNDEKPPVRVIRSDEVDLPAFHLIAAREELAALTRHLLEGGAHHGDLDDWTVLRVEAGHPVFGMDMDDGVIPTEAGIEDRVIDHQKGCYTGQEVIVRIRDRGHVNRRLRQVTLGDVAPPEVGSDLWIEGREKPAAEVRSAVRSPRFGETVALAYVRRDVWDGTGEQPTFLLEPPTG